MSGRNRPHRRPENFRYFHEDPRPVPLHRGRAPIHPPAALENELDFQQREIQRILSENRHVIDDNVMLERELNAVKDEILGLNQAAAKRQADREAQTRELMDRAMMLEADLRSVEPLRIEVKQLRTELQKLGSQKQDLSSKVQSLSKDLNQLRTESKQVAAIRGGIDKSRVELADARRTYEYEKKGNEDIAEQNRAMESNITSMAREIELLRAELAATDRRSRGTAFSLHGTENTGLGGYVMVNGGSEAKYAAPYADVYGNAGHWGALDKRGAPRR